MTKKIVHRTIDNLSMPTIAAISRELETTSLGNWQVAVLAPDNPNPSRVEVIGGDRPVPAASLGKLLVALAILESGIPLDKVMTIKASDQRQGGILCHFPPGYRIDLARVLDLMCRGDDNTAAIIAARAARGRERNTAGALNEMVREKFGLSPDTGLQSTTTDAPERFSYGHITPSDTITLFSACLKASGPIEAGLSHGSMWYGMRREVDSVRRVPFGIQAARYLARATGPVRELLPGVFYDELLATAKWPETFFPNKEGSLNCIEGVHVRSEVAKIGRMVVAVMNTRPDTGRREPVYGHRDPVYNIFASIGAQCKIDQSIAA